MKKLVSIMLVVLALVAVLASCETTPATTTPATTTPATTAPATTTVEDPKSEGVMTYDEYVKAELKTEVVIEAYVQAHQSWWDNKITVYAQDRDGAYFLYEMPCSEADAAKLVPGTKIKVKGIKAEWSGEVEITWDAETTVEDKVFEIIEGSYIAPAFDATSLLGTDDLIKHQNEFVTFKGLTVEKVEYRDGQPGDDIYLTFKHGENSYNFCVEVYLTGTDSDVYKAVADLKEGDKVDVEGFLYWYNGANPHVTSITVVK
ncbi:MAG: hypothetical protein E7675_03850 [Ruminococcaceae bacterium]|nr:hypothetical protein [Oscillospiraceae bacterium]